jgi:RNA polymerase sigma-70 factor, ECF subfamily
VLWRDLQPTVLRYFQVAAGEVAEDPAAETWVSVIRNLGRFRGDERDFRAWVFTVARHRAVDWRRQAARRPTRSVPVAQLAERPADQAEVVALRVLGGLEVGEVARIVGKRPGTVRVLAHRGLRRLAQRVETAGLARGVTR